MPRAIRRFLVLSGVALCAVFGGPLAVAQASDNSLRATLNNYAPTIVNDENAVKNGIISYPQGQTKPLIDALTHEVADLHALKTKLEGQSASSANGSKAKTEIVNGLGLIATAYGALGQAVQDAHGGPVSSGKANAAVATDKKGRKKLKAGLDLLRVA